MKLLSVLLFFSLLSASECFVLPILESGEQKIIAQMAATPEWRGELQPALPCGEQIQSFVDQGYTIQSVEIPRKLVLANEDKHSLPKKIPNSVLILDTPDEVKAWLFQEVIPTLHLAPSRQEAFIEDFLSYLDGKGFIYRKLILEVSSDELF